GLVGATVDGKEQVSLLHELIVRHAQIDDGTAHMRGDADDVGADRSVVGARTHEVQANGIDACGHRAYDDRDANGAANDMESRIIAFIIHRSTPIQNEPAHDAQEHPKARVDQGQRTHVRFQPGEDEDIANCDGESAADKDRNHPAREKGTSDVQDGIATRSNEEQRRIAATKPDYLPQRRKGRKGKNSKSEYGIPKQTFGPNRSQIAKIPNTQSQGSSFGGFLKFGHLNLFRISDFVLRI